MPRRSPEAPMLAQTPRARARARRGRRQGARSIDRAWPARARRAVGSCASIAVSRPRWRLAEAEARTGDPDRAIAILDEALATCDRIGYRAFEAELHRVRGEILLKCDPSNPAPAEHALSTAIAVAREQGARSFELRAALALAKLYHATGRAADAHAVLAPA